MEENKNYKIVIRGGYGFANFGDDALMKIIHDKLKTYELEENMAYICKDANYLKGIVNSTDIFNFDDLTKINFKSNILLYGGGTQFYSFNKESIFSKFIRNLKYPDIIFKLAIKKMNYLINSKKKDTKYNVANHDISKTAAISVGLGPFLKNSDTIENKTFDLFKNMSFVAVRDEFSKNKCAEWKLENFQKYSDACYSMKINSLKESKKIKLPNKIGVIVRDWNHTEEGRGYYNNLVKSVEVLRNKNFEVKFIVFADSDVEWINKLSIIKENILLWNPNLESIDNFTQVLNNFDFFITARFHGAIFSSLLDKPFITIGVEQKLKLIHEEFSNGSLLWQSPFNVNELIEKSNQIFNNYETFRNSVEKSKIEKVILSEKMFADFQKFYLKKQK